MAVILEIIDVVVCRKTHGCGTHLQNKYPRAAGVSAR